MLFSSQLKKNKEIKVKARHTIYIYIYISYTYCMTRFVYVQIIYNKGKQVSTY